MRVLIFHPALAPYRVDFFNQLSKIVDLKVVFSFRDVTYQTYDQDRLRADCKFSYEYARTLFAWQGRCVQRDISKAINDFDADVVVTSELSSATLTCFLFGFMRRFRHLIWTDVNIEIVRDWPRWRQLLFRWALNRADGVIVISDELSEFLRAEWNISKKTFISPLVQDESKWNLWRRVADGVHGSKDYRQVLFVGRLVPEKNLSFAIEVFERAFQRDGTLRLRIIGEGPEREKIQVALRRKGLSSVASLGGHKESRDLYREYLRSDVLILCSRYEAWGAVVDEALMSGMPVVCGRRVGAKEIIRDGINGYVVAGDDPATWATALIKAVTLKQSEPRQSLQIVTLESAIDGFVDALHN